jgi:hypothetical protein
MNYEEFKEYKLDKDPQNPFTPHFIISEEVDFYVEPVVFTQLHGFKERHPDKYDLIVESMIKKVKELKKVIFVGDFENYFTEKDDYIYLELLDITNPLKIFVEDKSRGSDYGD